jgi:hypothetical protein
VQTTPNGAALLLAACVALAGAACSSGRSGPSQSSVTAACMHICMCETGLSDTTCLSRCSMGSGTSSFSSFSSSLSTSFSLTAADQACIDCITAATCTELTTDSVCNTECQ